MGEPFIKLQGLGNDFILVDRRALGRPPEPAEVVRWCDRHRGIGADGVLALLPSARAPARMHVTNADGSHAETCGNGVRCVAKYLGDRDPAAVAVRVDTEAGMVGCELLRSGGKVVEVVAEMGRPVLDRARIPAEGDGPFVAVFIEAAGVRLRGTALSMGNPHLVLFDAPLDRAAELGPRFEAHPLFPQRTNVAFAAQEGGSLRVQVWERGAGLTQACGTGACAVAVAAVLEGRLPPGREIRVELPGGPLWIQVAPGLGGVRMRGEAAEAYRGEMP